MINGDIAAKKIKIKFKYWGKHLKQIYLFINVSVLNEYIIFF